MKASLVLVLVMLTATFVSGRADDITFTNKTATFTNLQGQLFNHVQLVRGDLDGLIWRESASGGRICYTNLNSDLLESFGISSNRVEIARARAEHKAVTDARYRAAALAEAQAKLHTKTGATNRAPYSPGFNGTAIADGSGADYGYATDYGQGNSFNSGPAYFPGYYYYPGYYPGFVLGPGGGSVPRAPSAPSAPSVPLAPSAPSAPLHPPVFVPPPVAKPVHL